MLTINANDPVLMNHFHKPTDKKRMVVILPTEIYQDWLEAPLARVGEFLVPYLTDALVTTAPTVL